MNQGLTVRERMSLIRILPRTGSLSAIDEIAELRKALFFSDEEKARCRIVEEGGRLTWGSWRPPGVDGVDEEALEKAGEEAEKEAPIEFTPSGLAIIVECLGKMNEDGTLDVEEHLTIAHKFLPSAAKEKPEATNEPELKVVKDEK